MLRRPPSLLCRLQILLRPILWCAVLILKNVTHGCIRIDAHGEMQPAGSTIECTGALHILKMLV